MYITWTNNQRAPEKKSKTKQTTTATKRRSYDQTCCRSNTFKSVTDGILLKIPSVAKTHFQLSCFTSCVIFKPRYTIKEPINTSICQNSRAVCRTHKVCCYSNTANYSGHAIFAWHESTLARSFWKTVYGVQS